MLHISRIIKIKFGSTFQTIYGQILYGKILNETLCEKTFISYTYSHRRMGICVMFDLLLTVL